MDYISQIRCLARSSYWQNIYNAAQEIGSLKLFENKENFSGLQSIFLYWLRVYNLLYSELANQEWKYLSEEVINDDCRCDAFLFWREKQKEHELEQNRQEQKKSQYKFKKPGNVSLFDVDLRGK